MTYLLISIAISGASGLISIICAKAQVASKLLACFGGIFAALFAIAAGVSGVFNHAEVLSWNTILTYSTFSVQLNALSGLMLLIINVLACAAWVYGISYFDEYKNKGLGRIGFFMSFFILSMNLLVVADNAFWFLFFFEIMSLTSYCLVILSGTEEAKSGGLMYLIVAHIGFLLIAVSFFTMTSQTSSLEFSSYRQAEFSPEIASAVFLLAFIGFGCKAGIVPLHTWLPLAHPAAPSNVSAMMSGGMIKIGIFGMLKVTFDLLGAQSVQMWWGVTVLIIGCVYAVFGIMYAIQEHDAKRLLAYSSVENIGVILMGFGTCIIGICLQTPILAILGLVAALYHAINHATFKGLLFMGAGAALYSTGTRDMNKLGGLMKVMPAVSICFLIAALAISAIPPLNGFASEWFTYQSMFTTAMATDGFIVILMAFAIIALAITGALAAATFVKVYGITFLGKARSEQSRNAKKIPATMIIPL